MLISPNLVAPHLDLSGSKLALRRLFPWAFSIRKILHFVRPRPFLADHLLIGSDYGGLHRGSQFHTFAYLISSNPPSSWLHRQRQIRKECLKDGRRMSFKHLNDYHRQNALIPVLQAADQIDGHLIVVSKQKSIRPHGVNKKNIKEWCKAMKVSCEWKTRAFESALFKTHIFGLIVSQWSKKNSDVCWITDEDEFVANDQKLDDAQFMAAKFSTMYSIHSFGEFAMNSTAIDGNSKNFEDYIAIADLAAGAMADLLNAMPSRPHLGQSVALDADTLRTKSDLICDWFWFPRSRLSKTCIVIEKHGSGSIVYKLDQPFYDSTYTP